MEGTQPQIHFIDAPSFAECEKRVNTWINELPFLCMVFSVNVMPMLLEGKLTFLTVILYTEQPSYMNSKKERN